MVGDTDVSLMTRDFGFTVLVVDCDPTSLMITSRMLLACGYTVITADCASDAFHILEYQQDYIDLILTELHFPDMDKYQFLERLGETSSLPVVVLSADDDEKAMLGCLFKGAEFYLVKPITMNIVRNIWQFSYMKKKGAAPDRESSDNFDRKSPKRKASNADIDCQSHSKPTNGKRKRRKDEANKVAGGDGLIVQKKQKLIWTKELHNRFVQVVEILGIDNAHPKKILQHMNVPGLKKEHISSHLQKYRLLVKRNEEEVQDNAIGDFNLPSAYNSSSESLENSTTARRPELTCRFCSYKVISPAYSIPGVSSADHPNHGVSDQNDASMSSDEQVPPQPNQLYSSQSNSIGGLSSFDTADVYVPTSEESSLTKKQENFQEQLELMLPPLSPVAPELRQDLGFSDDVADIDVLFDPSKWSEHICYDILDSCDLW